MYRGNGMLVMVVMVVERTKLIVKMICYLDLYDHNLVKTNELICGTQTKAKDCIL